MWRLQHADVYSVDHLLSRRRGAILGSGRFRAALTPTKPEAPTGSGRGGPSRPAAARAWGMLPITASHALVARLVQAGHGSTAIAREVLSAVSMYSLSPTHSDTVFDERVRDSALSLLSPRELQSQLQGTCKVLLQECKFEEFEGFLRVRIGMANALLRRHLQEYTRLVLAEIAKYSTADNEVVAEDGYVPVLCNLCRAFLGTFSLPHGLYELLSAPSHFLVNTEHHEL